MIKNLKFQILNSEAGITLIEIIIVIFIVTIFSLILIADFPEIEKQHALSSATYKLAQDFRKAQDLGLSAVQLKDVNGYPITAVRGYGIYVYLPPDEPATKYVIYADIDDNDYYTADGQKFDNTLKICDKYILGQDSGDCIIETVDVSKNNPAVYIEDVKNISGESTSINFSPPGPTINIENLITTLSSPDNSRVGITLDLKGESVPRTVWVNTSGMINIQ